MKKLIVAFFVLFLGLTLVSCSSSYSNKSEKELEEILITRTSEMTSLSVEIALHPEKAEKIQEITKRFQNDVISFIGKDSKEDIIKLIEVYDKYIKEMKKLK